MIVLGPSNFKIARIRFEITSTITPWNTTRIDDLIACFDHKLQDKIDKPE